MKGFGTLLDTVLWATAKNFTTHLLIHYFWNSPCLICVWTISKSKMSSQAASLDTTTKHSHCWGL